MLLRAVYWCVALLSLACCSAWAEPADWAWRDEAFEYQPGLVQVEKDDLFRLETALRLHLGKPAWQDATTRQRLKELLSLIFEGQKQFAYSAGHSTIASETWQRRRGDCLSLTVLTYSVAKALGIPAQMQEVRVPPLFDRRGQVDAVNQHVNVLFRGVVRDLLEDPYPRDVVVDFEPEFGSRRVGHALSEQAILARYYNNVATEHLMAGQRRLAYAHFRAAVAADPTYGPSYGNLAVLYRQAGFSRDAELLLRQAIGLSQPADVPLFTLHQLLTEQGRQEEARVVSQSLESSRELDPYHWIGLGLAAMEKKEFGRAVGAFERARDMASGFDEIHRYLALAYWRSGDPAKARQEMEVMALGGDDAGVSTLKGKLRATQQP